MKRFTHMYTKLARTDSAQCICLSLCLDYKCSSEWTQRTRKHIENESGTSVCGIANTYYQMDGKHTLNGSTVLVWFRFTSLLTSFQIPNVHCLYVSEQKRTPAKQQSAINVQQRSHKANFLPPCLLTVCYRHTVLSKNFFVCIGPNFFCAISIRIKKVTVFSFLCFVHRNKICIGSGLFL